ncbi:cytochrome P450 94A1-like [Silene latifolia]|uniref:cytochrome P450 94A1-like n=1 Tax=Silene latifolia TaxID=37657 RepID=UPI003D783F4F
MFELGMFLPSFLFCTLSLIFLLFINKIIFSKKEKTSEFSDNIFPKSYPLIGHVIAFYQHKHDRFQWLVSLIVASPSATFTVHRPFGRKSISTGDPAVVEHILKTRFTIYEKGPMQKAILEDLLGDGIFNVDGAKWKFQRQVASHEFNTKSLRKFVENVVDSELSDRLIPILSSAAKNQTVLDLQDILQRFAFDNICKISFGYDPEYLSPSLPQSKFAVAFEDAVMISSMRFRSFFPIFWKIQRFLNVGSEKKLKLAVTETREFANSLIRQKKQQMLKNPEGTSLEAEDLLSRFLVSGHVDEKFVADIVISFMLAGRDTTSSALTWFFWLLNKNKQCQEEIVKEIGKNQSNKTENSSIYQEVKDMTYTHAALCEAMRLYPPVAADSKEAASDDVLPGGTVVKKGTWVTYNPYAMGRLESIWGSDWAEYRPERWLEVEGDEEKWKFVPRDPYSYPVFQAGPRVCLGREMAFLQMKRVVAGVLARFKVVPVIDEGIEPVYLPYLTAKMKGGLPVRIEERALTK